MSSYKKIKKMKSGRKDVVVHKDPSVHVRYDGLFTFNRSAVKHLGLNSGVSFCVEKSSRNCFAVMRDDNGYCLRRTTAGQMLFNNYSLARNIINSTFERCPLPAGVEKPKSVVFVIASLPVDDGENKDVYALIQKK